MPVISFLLFPVSVSHFSYVVTTDDHCNQEPKHIPKESIQYPNKMISWILHDFCKILRVISHNRKDSDDTNRSNKFAYLQVPFYLLALGTSSLSLLTCIFYGHSHFTETATHCHVSQKYLISTMHKGKWTKTGSRELNPLWLLLPAKLSCDFTLTWSQRDSAVYSLDLLLESLYAHLHVKEMYRRGISATVWKDEIILR